MLLPDEKPDSPWPGRFSIALVATVFPLLWVGGLVTTYQAGMAVYDWPSTYGYNLFLYPLSTWVAGPFDLFVEHGHRLLGALAGIICIALLISTLLGKSRRPVPFLASTTLGLVILQGMLGGMRVLFDDRQLAMVHGCVGPLCFVLACILAVVTSQAWRNARPTVFVGASRLHVLSLGCALLAYVQLMLGAQLRHIPVTATHDQFRVLVVMHLAGAAVVTLAAISVAAQIFLGMRERRLLAWATALGSLVLFQLFLGASTWIAKYGWPLADWNGEPILNKSFAQSITVTLHVATGSLIVAVAAVLSLWSVRLVHCEKIAGAMSESRAETNSDAGINPTHPARNLDFSPELQGVSA